MTEAFRLALVWLTPIEGGWWPGNRKSDPNPTMRGITQRTYDAYRKRKGLPLQTVRDISDPEHDEIYFEEYWQAAQCHLLNHPGFALVHFDAAVNHGVKNAKKLRSRVAATAPTPDGPTERYIQERERFYEAIVAANEDMRPNLEGWKNRMRKLRRFIKRYL